MSNRDVVDELADELKLGNLISNVKSMAVFAAEKGILPEDIKLGEIYTLWSKKHEDKERLSHEEINTIARHYRVLESVLGNVSAYSLKATSCSGMDDCMQSDAGRYVKRMFHWVLGLILLIATINIYDYYYETYFLKEVEGPLQTISNWTVVMDLSHQAGQYLIPFTFGTLGAIAFILRFSMGRLHKREFDPRRVPGNYIRIVLGTICGGAIVMFIDSSESNNGFGVGVTAASLGFVAGYSTDVLFEILERLKTAVSPKAAEQEMEGAVVDKQTFNRLASVLGAKDKESVSDKPDGDKKGMVNRKETKDAALNSASLADKPSA